ncbi:MAG: molybdopterin-binding protein [Ferruginibacter sp.]
MINASIITIGDELLIGQVIDTNSAWMAQELEQSRYQSYPSGSRWGYCCRYLFSIG